MKAGNSSTIDERIEYHSNPAVVDMGLYKEAESSPGAGEPNDFGVNASTGASSGVTVGARVVFSTRTRQLTS